MSSMRISDVDIHYAEEKRPDDEIYDGPGRRNSPRDDRTS